MESRQTLRKAQFKDIFSADFERRKSEAKSDSDDARRRLVQSIRSHSEAARELTDTPTRQRSDEIRVKKMFAKTFMYPDSMVTVPADLAENWLVMLKPQGDRCLVILDANAVYVRSKNGSLILTFLMDPFSVKKTEGIAVFDAIYGMNEATMKRQLFIFDVIFMKGNELVFSDFTFRQHFLKQHWPFGCDAGAPVLGLDMGDSDVPDIVHLEALPITKSTILSLYEKADVRFETDSLVFHRKDGKYENGLTAEALVFRDSVLSRYSIDTKYVDGFEGDECQEIVLRAALSRKDNTEVEFKTWDGIVVKQISVSDATVPKWMIERLRKKEPFLVKIQVDSKFEFVSFAVSKKPFANSFNRIVDQFRKRRVAMNLDPVGLPLLDAPPVDIAAILDIVSANT